jgi:hypothetical protein
MVAVKLFEALRLDQADERVLNELRMEAQMMERLSNHPNIVKFVGAITQGSLTSTSIARQLLRSAGRGTDEES